VFVTAFHSIVHFLPWFFAGVTPTAFARLGARGIEAVIEYVNHASVLFDYVLAGGIVTARHLAQKKWRDRNVEFEVTIRQLYDPRLRMLCRRLLASVERICGSALSTRFLSSFRARKVSRHDAMALAGTRQCQRVVRHIAVVRLVGLRFSGAK
jgi:hypothetical protein